MNIQSIKRSLFAPIDPLRLDIFRVLFALILVLQFSSFSSQGFIERGILAPTFLFYYDYLPFIKPLSAGIMKMVLLLTLIGPLLMIFRKTLKIGAVIYFFSFGYLFFLDEAYYNNHFYLILMLTAFWFFYSPKKDSNGSLRIPGWIHALFVFMIILVYFFGGVVKINVDWLFHQQPVRELLLNNEANSPFPSFTSSEFAVMYITYGGILFDLLIGFLLLYRKTFPYAVVIAILFHITNHFIFNLGEGGNIGIFPFMMIGACVLFFPPEVFRKFLSKYLPGVQTTLPALKPTDETMFHKNQHIIFPLVAAWIILQVLLPFRPYVQGARYHWSGQAGYFCWRMKVNQKSVKAKFYVKYDENQPKTRVFIGKMVNTMQINMMGQHADMLYKFSHYLHDRLKRESGKEPIINATIEVAMNGRPYSLWVDSTLNLSTITYSPWKDPEWILPLKE